MCVHDLALIRDDSRFQRTLNRTGIQSMKHKFAVQIRGRQCKVLKSFDTTGNLHVHVLMHVPARL